MKVFSKNQIFVFALLVFIIAGSVFYFTRQKPQSLSFENVDVLISNAQVVTMDAKADVYNPGWIAVKDSKIIALGAGKPPAGLSAQKNIDAAGKVGMPGLINTHSHAAMTLLTGLGQGQNLQTWLNTMSGYESKLTADDVYWGTLLATDKMIKSGTTSFNDMYLFEQSAANAAEQSGMRAVVRIPTTLNNGQISFDDSLASADEGNPRISFSLAPNPLLDYTPTQLRQISDYALSKNLLVHIHFEEDAQARSDALAKDNLTPLELITQAGLLRNKIVLAHAVDLNDQEISALSQYPNAGVSFNPISEYNLQTPLTPVQQMLEQNITVALGTDGEPSSNLDMFAQMKFAAQNQSLDAQTVVQMATINGAKILGLDAKTGSLEAGKQADVIIVKPEKPDSDIYQALVYNTKGSDVTTTIVAGKLLMENGKILSLNEAEVLQNTQKISAQLKGAP